MWSRTLPVYALLLAHALLPTLALPLPQRPDPTDLVFSKRSNVANSSGSAPRSLSSRDVVEALLEGPEISTRDTPPPAAEPVPGPSVETTADSTAAEPKKKKAPQMPRKPKGNAAKPLPGASVKATADSRAAEGEAASKKRRNPQTPEERRRNHAVDCVAYRLRLKEKVENGDAASIKQAARNSKGSTERSRKCRANKLNRAEQEGPEGDAARKELEAARELAREKAKQKYAEDHQLAQQDTDAGREMKKKLKARADQQKINRARAKALKSAQAGEASGSGGKRKRGDGDVGPAARRQPRLDSPAEGGSMIPPSPTPSDSESSSSARSSLSRSSSFSGDSTWQANSPAGGSGATPGPLYSVPGSSAAGIATLGNAGTSGGSTQQSNNAVAGPSSAPGPTQPGNSPFMGPGGYVNLLN